MSKADIRELQNPGLVRRGQYWEHGDTLDALCKGMEAIRDSGVVKLPQDTLDMLEEWRAVKNKIPVD